MALVFHELATSRPLERSVQATKITLKWIAMHSDQELTVYNALLLIAPTRWDGFRRQSAKCDPLGGGVWMCEVEYGWSAQTLDSPDQPPQNDPGAPLGPEWRFDGTGGTSHIT